MMQGRPKEQNRWPYIAVAISATIIFIGIMSGKTPYELFCGRLGAEIEPFSIGYIQNYIFHFQAFIAVFLAPAVACLTIKQMKENHLLDVSRRDDESELRMIIDKVILERKVIPVLLFLKGAIPFLKAVETEFLREPVFRRDQTNAYQSTANLVLNTIYGISDEIGPEKLKDITPLIGSEANLQLEHTRRKVLTLMTRTAKVYSFLARDHDENDVDDVDDVEYRLQIEAYRTAFISTYKALDRLIEAFQKLARDNAINTEI